MKFITKPPRSILTDVRGNNIKGHLPRPDKLRKMAPGESRNRC